MLWNRGPPRLGGEEVSNSRRWFDAEPLTFGDILLPKDVHPHVALGLDAPVERAAQFGLRFGTPTEWLHV